MASNLATAPELTVVFDGSVVTLGMMTGLTVRVAGFVVAVPIELVVTA